MFSSEIKSVHFVGIGGTAMASAAAAMFDKGFNVTGSDQNVYEPMASFLAAYVTPKKEISQRAYLTVSTLVATAIFAFWCVLFGSS